MAKITLAQEASDPSAPPTSSWKIYAKAGGIYIEDSSGNITGPLGAGISAGTFAFTGDNLASPNTTTGTQDNVAAVGYSVYGWNGGSASTIDGFTSGAADRALIVYNMTSSQTLTLAHEATGSTATNRLHLPNGASVSISPYQGVMLVYDATTSRWYMSGSSASVAFGTDITSSAVGDVVSNGSGTTVAHSNHVHGREAFGSTPAAVGTAAAGTATTVAHSDHVHATGAGTPSTQAFGDSASTGSGPAAAMSDHKHGIPYPFWPVVPGSPARGSNTTVTLTDTGGANNYQYLLGRGTVLKWTESSTVRQAMVVTSALVTNTVTLSFIGDTMASIDAGSLRFATEKASVITLMIAGSIGATLNDASMRFFCPVAYHVFGATPFHGAAGTTNATTYTISKNSNAGSGTILSSALSIASGATSGNDQTTTSATTTASGDYLTANITGVSTTPATDAYINVYVFPDLNQWYS